MKSILNAALVGGTLSAMCGAHALTFQVQSLGLGNEPSTHNGQVAWAGVIEGESDTEVLFYDGSQTRRISFNTTSESTIELNNGQIFWASGTPRTPDWEVYFYDGANTSQITNNNGYDFASALSNGLAVWTGADEQEGQFDTEVFIYRNGQKSQLTFNSFSENTATVDNDWVAWSGYDGADAEIYLYDGQSIAQLSNNTGIYDSNASISNGQVIWVGSINGTDNIYLYNGATTQQLTFSEKNLSPSLSNGEAVWMGKDANNINQVMHYKNGQITQLTSGNNPVDAPKIHNGIIAWREYTGIGYHVKVYDGQSIQTLTQQAGNNFDVSVHNQHIVWTSTNQVMLAKPVTEQEVGDLEVLYKNQDNDGPNSNMIKPLLRLVNLSNDMLRLKDYSLRYWYSNETAPANQIINVFFVQNETNWQSPCYYPHDCIKTSSGEENGHSYVQVEFKNAVGELAPEKALRVEFGVNAANWQNYNQANDYSYAPPTQDLLRWEKITVYNKGTLVFGTEPN